MKEKRSKQGIEKKRAYINNYNKVNRKSLTLAFNMRNDLDRAMYDYISNYNKAAYIKGLIIEDMKKEGK